jgi:anaerobic magnesium-protoporphyrin IX monomethyl ester cyclase
VSLKIQLLHPPGIYHARNLSSLTPSLPLGLAYVAAALERAGFPVGVIDAIGEAPTRVEKHGEFRRVGLGPADILGRIDADTRVIGISLMFSFLWPSTRELIAAIRAARPDVLLVGGGEHFTGLAAHSMGEAPIDFIVMGEGEETIVELMEVLAAGRTDFEAIAGLAWRQDGRIRVNPRRARHRNVDDIAWPAWRFFDVKAYDDQELVNGIHKGLTIPILATRGCPYQCTYCSSPSMWTQRWLPRDPVDVADEIEHYVRTYGATNFPFQDLTAIIRKDWIVTFCRELIRRRLNVVWQFPSGTRCEAIDDEVAPLLRDSGGRHLAFAPESGSERTRGLIKKKMTTPALLASVRASVRAGLNVTAFFVLGFPHDTGEDIHDTVRLARRLAIEGIDDINMSFFFPIPNTELYHDLVRKGRVRLTDGFFMAPITSVDLTLRDEDNYCEALSARRLTALKYWVFLNFYVTSFLVRPARLLRLLTCLVTASENSKLEAFIQEMKRRLRISLGHAFGGPGRRERDRPSYSSKP